MSDEITIHHCGPSTNTCECNCPESCGYEFSGNRDIVNENGRVIGGETVCVKCGLGAMEHSMWVGP